MSRFFSVQPQNGAKAYGGSYDVPRGVKNSEGKVTLQGLLTVPVVAATTVIGQIPAEVAPPKSLLVSAVTGLNGKTVRLDIRNDGTIIFRGGTIESFISLSGISFLSVDVKVPETQAVSGIARKHGGGNYTTRLDHVDANGNYVIQVSEYNGTSTATLDWFTVDPLTGDYTSMFQGYSGNVTEGNEEVAYG